MNSPSTSTDLRRPPSPRGVPILGLLPELSKDPLGFFLRMGRMHPHIVQLNLGVREMMLVSHPEQVKYILQENNKNYAKGYDKARPVLGNGLVTAEGEEWRQERRMMQPAFNHASLVALMPLMVAATQDALADWQLRSAGGHPLDMAREWMMLTQTIIVRTMFSADLGGRADQIADAFATALEYLNSILLSPLPFSEKLPTPLNRRFRAAMRYLDGVIHEFIAARRARPSERRDLLAMLMEARDSETGQVMSEQQMRDEIMTIFLAGHETTATLLAWTTLLLGQHPNEEARVREEFERELAGDTASSESMSRLSYTRQVFEESLRLYPPAWMFARKLIADDEIGGCHVPAGTMITLSPYVTQRMEEFWPEPERFDPGRFAPEHASGRAPYAWFPFGGGPRLCIGKPFAMMEAALLLSMAMQRFRFKLVPGQMVIPQPLATLRPKPAVWVLLEAV